jgi:hypothetical protein
MDPDDALHDIHLDPTPEAVVSQSKKTKKSRTLDVSIVEGDKPKTKKTRLSTIATSKKKDVPSPPALAVVAAATKMHDANDNDIVDTEFDDDFVDKSMEAQIMADLESLRKLP